MSTEGLAVLCAQAAGASRTLGSFWGARLAFQSQTAGY